MRPILGLNVMGASPRRTSMRFAVVALLAGVGCGSSDSDEGTKPKANAGATGDLGFQPYPDNNGDGKPDTGPGCSAIDILFVIDNSPSMKPYQEGLAAAFPGFVDAMIDKLPVDTDLHVGMTTTSFFHGNCSEGFVNCQTTATPEEVKAHYTAPTEGNTGVNGEQGRLFEFDGKHYFATNTSDKESGLKEWFSKAAVAAGEMGCSFEMSSAGAAYAFDPVNDATNKGFVRDEKAVLLLFVLSDEPDKSPEELSKYQSLVRKSKDGCGGDQCIVTSGLVTPCVIAGQNQLSDFLNGFGEKSVLGSIEDPDKYTDVVGAGLAQVVHDVCAAIPDPK